MLPLGRVVMVAIGAAIYATFTFGSEALLAPVVGYTQGPWQRGEFAAVLAVLIPLALAALTLFWVLLPNLASFAWVRRLRVHATNGWYIHIVSERVVGAIWLTAHSPRRGQTH